MHPCTKRLTLVAPLPALLHTPLQHQKLAQLNCATRKQKPMMDKERTDYELAVGHRVSDSHWSRTKRILSENNMIINTANVVFYAKLRKQFSRISDTTQLIRVINEVDCLLTSKRSRISGAEFLQTIQNYGIKPHKTTLSRWFKQLGGFRKTRLYFPEKLTPVLTAAFLYKINNSKKLGA